MRIVQWLRPQWLWIVLATATLILPPAPAGAQITTDRIEALRDNSPRYHALTGARLVLAPDRIIENGTLVMRDGIIVAAGTGSRCRPAHASGNLTDAPCTQAL